jgi:glycosyltransferase involved in cell wall biosynthesis
VNFFLTGRPPNSIRDQAPSNVTFTGYLSNRDYDQLLNRSDVVMALTTRELTMQRAGYEAFMAGKPQVTSAFTPLKDFYEDCAVYVEPAEAGSIAAGVREALQRTDELSKRAHRVADARLDEQAKQLEWLGNYVRAPRHVKRTMRLELKEGG